MTNPLDAINRVISQQTGTTTAPATKGLVCKKCSHAFEHNQADMPPTNCPACGELTSFIVYGSLKMAKEYAARASQEEEVVWEEADPTADAPKEGEHSIPFSPKSEAFKAVTEEAPTAEAEKPKTTRKKVKAVKPEPIPEPEPELEPEPLDEEEGEDEDEEEDEELARRREAVAAAREALAKRYKLDTLTYKPIGTAEAFAYGTTVWHDGYPNVTVWEHYLDAATIRSYIRDLSMDEDVSGLTIDCVQLTDISPELASAMARRVITASIIRKDGKSLGPIRVKLGDKVNIGAKVSQKGTIILQVLNVIK